VDARSGAAEIIGLDDRTLIERFSKRSEQIDQWLSEQGLSGIKASSAAAVATRAPKDHSESEADVYQRWGRELAEQGVGERQLAEVCSGGRGRPATRTEVDAVLSALSGPDGLTAEASTFTRTDLVDALAKQLPVAPSAQAALTQAEQVADRFLAERAVRVAHDRRLGVERYSVPELLTLDSVLRKRSVRSGMVSLVAARQSPRLAGRPHGLSDPPHPLGQGGTREHGNDDGAVATCRRGLSGCDPPARSGHRRGRP
jgi:hypothetical protein